MKNDDMFLTTMKWVAIFTVALCLLIAWDSDSSESWDGWLKEELVGEEIIWKKDHILIDAPYRAMNPAGVEIFIDNSSVLEPDYSKLTLVIDENPTPCCAIFEFMGIHPAIKTNVRINAYTDLTVLAEDEFKNISYNQKFVKAAGGCSAPPMITSSIPFGAMNVTEKGAWTNIKIYHPNYSGMQIEQLTGIEIPAEYIETVKVFLDNETIFEYTGTIGIGQDVFFELPFRASGKNVKVWARDNLGREFKYEGHH